jgi:Protein of unknown function (DUF3574)
MSRYVRLIDIAVLAGLSACAGPARPPCAPGVGAPMAVFTLYLGKAIPGRGDLTEKEWQSFLDDTVTAVLPNGYTILDANGAWMNPVTHKTIREATKILVAALPQTPDSLTAINHIRSDYQIRFHQQLVGMTVEQACGTF